jgi:hypothetical protein
MRIASVPSSFEHSHNRPGDEALKLTGGDYSQATRLSLMTPFHP